MDTQSHTDIVYLLRDKLKLADHDIRLQMISDPGSSQSRVYLFRAGDRLIAVKQGVDEQGYRPDVLSEATKREVIEPFLTENVARVFWSGTYNSKPYMLYECIGSTNLHTEVLSRNMSTHDITSIWTDMLSKLLLMWHQSKKSVDINTTFAREYSVRFERIESGIANTLSNLADSPNDVINAPIQINGRDFPSLTTLIADLKEYDSPEFTITCHGDPQPSNIIVDPISLKWQLIDWEWSATNHDWRMMSAHLVGWWLSRTVTFLSRPTISFDNSKLIIHYEIAKDDENRNIAQRTITEIDKQMGLLQNDRDHKQFKKFLALLLLGDVRFLHIWHRQNHLPYLIAKAVEIYYADEKYSHEAYHG